MADLTRILAVDYGSRRVGLAVSDPLRMFARPREALANEGDDAVVRAIAALVRAECVGEVVLGLPLGREGQDTAQTSLIRAFGELLAAALPVPVRLHDESFTSADAEKLLRERGLNVRQSRGLVDSTAAALLLEEYLRMNNP